MLKIVNCKPIYDDYKDNNKNLDIINQNNQTTIQVPANMVVQQPIYLYFNDTQDSIVNIKLAKSSSACFIVHQEPNVSANSEQNIKINCDLQQDSNFQIHNCSLSGQNINTSYEINLQQPGASFDGFILQNSKANQKHKLNLNVNHQASYCNSNIIARGLCNDNALSSCTATVIVAPHAKQTNTNFQSKQLVLSNNATAFSQPQLIINHDNVVCKHGASIGTLDKQALFYLQSRGIPLLQAKNILIDSFLSPFFTKLNLNSLATHLQQNICIM